MAPLQTIICALEMITDHSQNCMNILLFHGSTCCYLISPEILVHRKCILSGGVKTTANLKRDSRACSYAQILLPSGLTSYFCIVTVIVLLLLKCMAEACKASHTNASRPQGNSSILVSKTPVQIKSIMRILTKSEETSWLQLGPLPAGFRVNLVYSNWY